MKLVSLNVWGGRIADRLVHFISEHSDVDIFLFQEMYHRASEKTNFDGLAQNELFDQVASILPNHVGYFASTQSDEFGLAIFAHKNLIVHETGDVFVHRFRNAMEGKDGRTLGRSIQYIKIAIEDGALNVINFHGLWNGEHKNDSEERIKQSEIIIEFLKTLHGEVILAGDFNLMPETVSLKMIERQFGYRNLIQEYGITSTRPAIYKKPERFADYALVSAGIRVDDFKVLPDEVSDHLPLYLVFALQ